MKISCSTIRLCLVVVILGRMENEREKIMFLIVWLRLESEKDERLVGPTSFLSSPSKTQSLQIGEKMGVKSG